QSSSRSRSTTACGLPPPARRARSSSWRAGSACPIAPCAGWARSRGADCRRPRARRATGCLRRGAKQAQSAPPRPPATLVVTAHTLDDQAETVLLRMSRGSGLGGLGAMARSSPLPANGTQEITLVRPLLEIPKARLVATLARAKIAFADDASNRDPRFARARLREVMPALAREGLDARRLARLAGRLRRAEAAIEMAVDDAMAALSPWPWSDRGPIVFDVEKFFRLPAEVALRLIGRAIARAGDEGTIRLGKLETLYEALAGA